jgi:hypothetical protein
VKKLILSIFAALTVALVPVSTYADFQVLPQCTSGAANQAEDADICKAKNTTAKSIVQVVVNTLLYVVGAISVIMLIVGGIRYATSAGNSAQVTGAKNTIMYALIGLVISVLALVIVHFVIAAITTGKPA